MRQKKLQNYFKDFLPQNYFDFTRDLYGLTSNQAVVAELLRVCCEEKDVKAIEMAFERILGKPEKVVVIKRTVVRTLFPEAKTKALQPQIVKDLDVTRADVTTDAVVIEASNAPGLLLQQMIDEIGEKPRDYSYQVLENKHNHSVAEVMTANLYRLGMDGSNLGAIKLLFDYIDGSVADVIRLEGEDTILLENWGDVAPYDAKQDENGVFYVETEGIK